MTGAGHRRTDRVPTALLILPYFGPLPNYADLFFRTCAANPTVNWLLVTDQSVDASRLPENVAVKRTTFSALKRGIDAAVGFETALNSPYKLCDFRPAYGQIFLDDIAGFDLWGHCDLDILLGDVRRFLTPEILTGYAKVLIHGHFSLYRNSEEVNRYFLLETPDVSFRRAATTAGPVAFDEFGGIKRILEHHRIPVFRDDRMLADIDQHVYRLIAECPPNHRYQCFYWEDGRVMRRYWEGGHLGTQEYLYIHLQKRRMQPPPPDLHRARGWFIRPRDFVVKDFDPTSPAELSRMNPGHLVHDSRRVLVSRVGRLRDAAARLLGSSP